MSENSIKFIEAYQVPLGNISPDIFNLPCIVHVEKSYKRGIAYFIGGMVRGAYPTDWLCKDIKGQWHVLTDEQYKQFTKRE